MHFLFASMLLSAVALRVAGQEGEIAATVVAGKLSFDRAWAVELQLGKHIEGTVAGKGLRFTGLPLGTYCLVLKAGNHVVEGLRYPDEVYIGSDLAGEDRQAFEAEVRKQELFFDNKTLWSVQGGSKKAIAFVFNERVKSWWDNPTGLEIKDVIIRRYDVQVLRKSGVAWLQDNMFFLWREMIKRDEAKPMTHQFDEQLAGIALTKEKPKAKIELKF